MSVSVAPLAVKSEVSGGCSACSARSQVWRIHFGTVEVRVCAECRGELFRQLGGKGRRDSAEVEIKEVVVQLDPPTTVLNMVGTTPNAEWRETFHTANDARWFFRGTKFAAAMLYNDPLPSITFTEHSVVQIL